VLKRNRAPRRCRAGIAGVELGQGPLQREHARDRGCQWSNASGHDHDLVTSQRHVSLWTTGRGGNSKARPPTCHVADNILRQGAKWLLNSNTDRQRRPPARQPRAVSNITDGGGGRPLLGMSSPVSPSLDRGPHLPQAAPRLYRQSSLDIAKWWPLWADTRIPPTTRRHRLLSVASRRQQPARLLADCWNQSSTS